MIERTGIRPMSDPRFKNFVTSINRYQIFVLNIDGKTEKEKMSNPTTDNLSEYLFGVLILRLF